MLTKRAMLTTYCVGLWFWIPAALLSVIFTLEPAAAQGVPVLRDFEDLPAGTPVFNQYDGVTFLGGDNSDHAITITTTPATISPPQVLNFISPPEIGRADIIMQFDIPQTKVSVSSGIPMSDPRGLTLVLQGFETLSFFCVPGCPFSGTPVAQSIASVCSTTPTPGTTPLEISDPNGRIKYAVLFVAVCSQPQEPISGHHPPIFLDNLAYERPLNPPPRENIPPIIGVGFPANGSTIEGASPGRVGAITVTGNVLESALFSMSATLNGRPSGVMNYYRTGTNSYVFAVDFSASTGLKEGLNTLVVTAVDFDRPQNTSTMTSSFTFKIKPILTDDIVPLAFQVTQSIDRGPFYLSNFFINPELNPNGSFKGYRVSVPDQPPLFQGKRTLIQVYGAASGTTSRISAVPAAAFVRRDNCTNNCDISGGQDLAPLSFFNVPVSVGVPILPVTDPQSDPTYLANLSQSLNTTWNFLLQPDWTTQDLVVTIKINCCNVGMVVPECSSIGFFNCEENNTIELHLHFNSPPRITVNPVLIHVDGKVPRSEEVDEIFHSLNMLYPAIVIRGPQRDITVNADIHSGCETLAIFHDDLVERIKALYGNVFKTDTFFLGIFPGDQGTFTANHDADLPPGAIAAGCAQGQDRGAWTNAFPPGDAAHELAHNIGFDHWACEFGVDDDECRVFPINHGGTGVYATDIVHWKVIPPGDNSSAGSPHAHDFMTYGSLCVLPEFTGNPNCHTGFWVSWYTYDILRNHPFLGSFDTDD